MRRIAVVSVGIIVALTLPLVAFALASPRIEAEVFGNHNLQGLYEFRADGVVEVDGAPSRGFWEVGRFRADGKGNITRGKEYSSMLDSHDESVIDRNFTFAGTYTINPDGTGTGVVTVVVAPGVEITKKLWLVLHSIGRDGIANGFDGGHADAHLGGATHGNARSHVGHRVVTAR